MRLYKIYCIIVLLGIILNGCSQNTTDNKSDLKKDSGDSLEQEDNNLDTLKDGLTDNNMSEESGENPDDGTHVVEYQYNQELNILDDNYRTYYEVFLYSFYDSDGDGIGDINGLIEKLDYINDGDPTTDTDLGFNGIWLMPIMPSNTYHKYDVKNYYDIDPQYGTLEDFKQLITECNNRGIKVIIDLVLNHSSQLHPWFISALKSLPVEPCGQEICTHEQLCREHNPYVNYYHFVIGNPNRGDYYHTGVGDWYYEAVFTSNMPDLNLSNEYLRKEIEDILDYWLELGVGGFRLDAALHYEANDTDKNNEILSWINDYVKLKNSKNYIVAEVWTNFTTFAKYYDSGIDSVFNFAFATESGKIVKTLNYKGIDNSGKAFGEAMLQAQKGIKKYNETAIDAPFFTNHDTARAAGFFAGDTDKIKMAGGMNLMMSGNVFVYYGEELGMSGSGRDENKRAPMYWSNTDRTGMANGPKDMETVKHSFGPLETQLKDPLSIYNYYKRAIRLRNENPEIARGEIISIPEIVDPDICAITKTFDDSTIIMLYNISEETKEVSVPKSLYKYENIRGYLTVKGEEVTLSGETLTLAPYSIVILK